MRPFYLKHGGQETILANPAEILLLAQVIAVQRLLIAERHGRRNNLALPGEILTDRLGLAVGLQLAGLIHQVVENAKPFANTILGHGLGTPQIETGIGGRPEGQSLGLVALHGVTDASHAFHCPADLAGQTSDGRCNRVHRCS